MEASTGRRNGVSPLHRRPGNDVSTRDVICGDSGDSQRRRRDSSELPDVAWSSAAIEACTVQSCLMTHSCYTNIYTMSQNTSRFIRKIILSKM